MTERVLGEQEIWNNGISGTEKGDGLEKRHIRKVMVGSDIRPEIVEKEPGTSEEKA